MNNRISKKDIFCAFYPVIPHLFVHSCGANIFELLLLHRRQTIINKKTDRSLDPLLKLRTKHGKDKK